MDPSTFKHVSELEWVIEPRGKMNVPGVIFASEQLIRDMDEKVREQVTHVAELPGIVKASFAMPDAHWGYGFPIGGVAAFNADSGGVVSAGGVGFDISCGVRALHTGLRASDALVGTPEREALAEALFRAVPAGVGSRGRIRLDDREMDRMLGGGAGWAVERGYGSREDLLRIEDGGAIDDARPEKVSDRAKQRQRDEMGTLGSGNHYLEVQRVTAIHDARVAEGFGLHEDDVLVSVHCGSRGLGHQIGTEYLQRMAKSAHEHGIALPDRELACAPIRSDVGQSYLGAMRAAMNCALANRQIITHLAREAFADVQPQARLDVLYDVSHNICKLEQHEIDGKRLELFVHRKGATRAFGPGHPSVPPPLRPYGQPVLIGGTMGTASYVLAGSQSGMALAFGSACHGAGRAMSRNAAKKRWSGRDVLHHLRTRGIVVRSPSLRGVAEEAPGAYKDVGAVVEAADHAGLAVLVARLEPLLCVKG
jgi:tRNA-splicing ligase RtcB